MNTISFATTCNDNYFQGLAVMILSTIISHSGPSNLKCYVLDTGISETNKDKLIKLCSAVSNKFQLHFLTIDGTNFQGLNPDHGGGYSTYARLLIGSLLPESKVIYLDCDILSMKNIETAWNQTMGDNIMLATLDSVYGETRPRSLSFDCPFLPESESSRYNYFNCGYFVVNLTKWRQFDVENKAIEAARSHEGYLRAWDQTLLNFVLRGRIGIIDQSHCLSASWEDFPTSSNIHYISGNKPWNSWSSNPAYKAWYMFHDMFVRESIKLQIKPKGRRKSIMREIRDQILARSPSVISKSYVIYLLNHRGPDQSSLYDKHIQKLRNFIKKDERLSQQTLMKIKAGWNDFNRSHKTK